MTADQPLSNFALRTNTPARLKTAFVCQWYPPEPVEVPRAIANALKDKEHRVDVLTGIPNYPSGSVSDGYHAWRPSAEVIDGIRIRRAPLVPGHDASVPRRMLNYLSWAISSTIFGAGVLKRADVALVYSSPATAALGPALWSRLTHTPFVLMIQDLWPDSVISSGLVRNELVARTFSFLMNGFVDWTYRKAAHITVISPGMIDVLQSRGVPRDKISLIYNWADEPTPSPVLTKEAARSALGIGADSFVVTYAGNHGPAQGLDAIIRAAAQLRNHKDIQFIFAGDGLELDALKSQAETFGCQNVTFLGRLERSRMPALRRASDVQVVSLIDKDLFAVTMPSKIQSILASGSPLIVMAPGDPSQVAEASGSGWAVSPGDDAGFANAVMTAYSAGQTRLRAMGDSGRLYYQRNMCEQIGAMKLDQVLRKASTQVNTRQKTEKYK